MSNSALKQRIVGENSGSYATFPSEKQEDPRDSNDAQEEDDEEEEEEEREIKVSTLELFSDLVIVVAIHYVAEPLEEFGEHGEQHQHLSSYQTIMLYIVQVTMLWMVWHNAMVFMNGAALFESSSCPLHHGMIALVMFGVLSLTKQFEEGIPIRAVICYLFVRLLEVMAYSSSSLEEPKPDWVPAERVASMRSFVPIMVSGYVLCEIIPLTVAATFTTGHKESQPNVFWVSVCLYVAMNTVAWLLGAVLSDRKSGGRVIKNLFVADHLHERYELVTLICIGELCFAAGNVALKGGSGVFDMILTAAPFALAFGSYLVIFATRHECSCRTVFWHKSACHMVSGMISFLGLFCAIPAMGSGFGRIFETLMEEEEGEEESEHGKEGEHSSCVVPASYFLCWSTAAFLCITVLISLLDHEPTREAAGSQTIFRRLSIRLFGAALIVGLFVFLPENAPDIDFCLWVDHENSIPLATIACPIIVLMSVMLEIHGAGTMRWIKVSGFSLTFRWTDL